MTPDLRELVVDDAIEFAALRYEPPVRSQIELERVFWDAAHKRVDRAREGRYDTIRAGFHRADLAALDSLSIDATPEDAVLARAEVCATLHFAALLDQPERDIYLFQQRTPGDKPPGAKRIAKELGLPLGTVRAAERTIDERYDRFAVICSAGRLCGYLAPAVADIAAAGGLEVASDLHGRELAARVHLEIERCPTCIADYTRQLRYLRGARFNSKVAALLPAPEASDRLRGAGWRDLLPDWAARLLSHEPTGAATQLAAGGAGRGLAASAAAHLAAICLGGAGTLGACVATGILPLPERDSAPPVAVKATPTPTPQPLEPEPTLPHGAVTPTPTATPTKRTRTVTPRRERASTTQGGTGPRSHEQAPISPAPSNAAPNGGSEFDPGYQPSGPTQPAPAPAAPGASEFN
ncbi:hypothetical protein C8N24_2818 [Solirubrobacter pauli]|uniref:Uncharacterized protein n=1 Tax=Solirubrobacter pauli TaxID=166793 RepID=A0A660LJ03_9ACTN|nr:hypothetical protein C8N24_2818 [Solirubrobacter pauli]